MDVLSTCPFSVGSVVWQPCAGAFTLTVIAKATFVLMPGESILAETQEEPTPGDRHLGGDPAGGLLAASDRVPFKARAEVVLVGHAFAPQRRPVRMLTTRLHVGEIDKRIEVWCDRVFSQDGRLLEGQPFNRMPLLHERAAGGPGTSNPAGMRFDAPPDVYGCVPIPNLQAPGVVVARRTDTFAPIGYGPIAASWPGRIDKLGRHGAGWLNSGWNTQPLPVDIDPAFFSAAPADQQLRSIRPDEPIVLENLHPDHPLLQTRLPGLRPRAHLKMGSSLGEEIELVADTLTIDTDRGLATMVFRGRLALSFAGEEGQIVVSMSSGGGGPRAPSASVEQGTLALPGTEPGTMLGGLSNAAALPFQPSKSPWVSGPPLPTAPSKATPPEDTGTVFGARAPSRDLLPFTRSPSAPAPFVEATSAPLPSFDSFSSVEPPRSVPLPAIEVVIPEPQRPAMLGAIAEEPAQAPEASPPSEKYPIERCAAIAASIARRREETPTILEKNDLSPADWATRERHWNDAITEELSHGNTELLQRFDAAYVAQLEAERGVITVEDYARIAIATERGKLGALLAELTLPRGSLIRIERVWLGKTEEDESLDKRIRTAVNAARAR